MLACGVCFVCVCRGIYWHRERDTVFVTKSGLLNCRPRFLCFRNVPTCREKQQPDPHPRLQLLEGDRESKKKGPPLVTLNAAGVLRRFYSERVFRAVQFLHTSFYRACVRSGCLRFEKKTVVAAWSRLYCFCCGTFLPAGSIGAAQRPTELGPFGS